MIEVTKLNGKQLYINGDLIERIEAVPDTIVCLTSGRKLIVRESVDEVIEKLTKTLENKENEFRELLNLLTIKHTYFFRNEPHFKALKENILPKIVKRKRNEEGRPAIRIWIPSTDAFFTFIAGIRGRKRAPLQEPVL